MSLIDETIGKVALARYTDPDGKVSVVQMHAPWQRLQKGAVYYSEIMKDHLKCICCEAKVKPVPASIAAGGSSGKGMNGYFRPEKSHDENCIVPMRKIGRPEQKIDRTKGFRIHINTSEFSSLFNDATGVYEISPGGKITIMDPDLRDREVYTVRDAKDLIKFIEKADPKRLNDSLIIFRNRSYEWPEFCIRHGKEARFNEVVERARGAKAEELPVVLMELKTDGTYINRFKGPITTIEGPCIKHGRDDRGKPRWIYPTVKINNRDAYSLFYEFGKAGSIFVLGQMHVDTWEGDFITKDSAIVYIQDARQIAAVNIENLKRSVESNAERSARRTARGNSSDFNHS